MTLRLDLFLKISTLIKRRSIAKMACENGKIFVNGKQCKASYEVKKNDLIVLKIRKPIIKIYVKDTEKKIGKKSAKEMFEIIKN